MTQGSVFTREALLASHDYVRPHAEAGYRLHGGFVEAGGYVSPRSLHRADALATWQAALIARGGALIDLKPFSEGGPWPNADQVRLLIKSELPRTVWAYLSLIGGLQARAGALCHVQAPDLQPLVEDDLSTTATGHLHKGLLWAHGADKAGVPGQSEVGGHDRTWIAVRDLLYPDVSYPAPAPAAGEHGAAALEVPALPMVHEFFLKFLMSFLILEARTAAAAGGLERVLQDPSIFRDRRTEADEAAILLGRLRRDAVLHTGYLSVVVSEVRSFTFKGPGRRRSIGASFIDPLWAELSANLYAVRSPVLDAILRQESAAMHGAWKADVFLAQYDSLDYVIAPKRR